MAQVRTRKRLEAETRNAFTPLENTAKWRKMSPEAQKAFLENQETLLS